MNILWDEIAFDGRRCVVDAMSALSQTFLRLFKEYRPDVKPRYKLFAPSSSVLNTHHQPCLFSTLGGEGGGEEDFSLRNTNGRMNNRDNGYGLVLCFTMTRLDDSFSNPLFHD